MRRAFRLTANEVVPLGDDTPDGQTPGWTVVALPRDADSARAALADALTRADLDTTGEIAGKVLDAHPHALATAPGVVVLHVPFLTYDTEADVTAVHEVVVVCSREAIVTASVSQGALDDVVERVTGAPVLHAPGTHWVLRHVLALAADHASAAEEDVAGRTAVLERAVFSEDVSDPVAQLYRVKRAIAEARRTIDPLVTKLVLVVDDEDLTDRMPAGAEQSLRRLSAAFERVGDSLDSDDRLLGDMLTAHLTLVQVRQNEDMRKISAYAALVAVPTLISGIYGMNFDHMPELTWTLGYPLSIVAMVLLVAGLRQWFRRSGWL